MSDFLSDDARLDPRATPADAGTSASGLDRRSFLRALSGSALTLVAGGLTVTLTACQGAGGGGSTPNTLNVPFSGVGPQTPPSAVSSSLRHGSGSSASLVTTTSSGSATSSTSGTSSATGSSGTSSGIATSSGIGTSSGTSGVSGSSQSSSSVSGALRRAAGKVNGWSTRV